MVHEGVETFVAAEVHVDAFALADVEVGPDAVGVWQSSDVEEDRNTESLEVG